MLSKRASLNARVIVLILLSVVDLHHTLHHVSSVREEDARIAIKNYIGEMGGGIYIYLTLVGSLSYGGVSQAKATTDQVRNGSLDMRYIDKTVEYILHTKFTTGLFESKGQVLAYINL